MYDKRLNFCGYFDSAHQINPAFDPGFGVPCPCCGTKVGKHCENNRLKTISIMDFSRKDGRSWFFRVHATCWNNMNEDDQGQIELSILENSGK